MSFSGNVKDEIAQHISSARHCNLAELASIIQFCGKIGRLSDCRDTLVIATENENVYRKCFTLLKKTFNINSLLDTESDSSSRYEMVLSDREEIWSILQGLKIIGSDGVFRGLGEPVNPLLIKNACCKRAYLRGAFLCTGSISDPNKGYHLELVCDTEDQAKQIIDVLSYFDLEGRMVVRKKYYVVYMKEGAAIVDFLNICEAHVALMELENLRIVREMRNSINRRVNCEAANITKTVNAATKQIEEIEYLRDHYGFNNLPANLREMAEVRLEHPDATLAELGGYLDPPVGKSGVNHRLRRLSEIAGQM